MAWDCTDWRLGLGVERCYQRMRDVDCEWGCWRVMGVADWGDGWRWDMVGVRGRVMQWVD